MASITIRQFDDKLKERLRRLAAEHGHSMEEEARCILRQGLVKASIEYGLGSRINHRFAKLGDIEWQPPARTEPPNGADFGS